MCGRLENTTIEAHGSGTVCFQCCRRGRIGSRVDEDFSPTISAFLNIMISLRPRKIWLGERYTCNRWNGRASKNSCAIINVNMSLSTSRSSRELCQKTCQLCLLVSGRRFSPCKILMISLVSTRWICSTAAREDGICASA